MAFFPKSFKENITNKISKDKLCNLFLKRKESKYLAVLLGCL